MKFLFNSPRYAGVIGGHAFMLSEQLKKQGHDVDLLHSPHLPIKNLKNPSFAFSSVIKSISNQKNYDIVHGFNAPSAFAMNFSKARKKVLSIHGAFSDAIKLIHSKPYGVIGDFVESKALKYADKITTDSKYTKKMYKENSNVDLEYLPSPIDISTFPDFNSKKIINQIAYVARADYGKGIDILENAESRINGKVVYCTNLPWKDAMETLNSSSVLAQPSRMESLATTIKESFFLKVPVVATNVGGNPELVQDNITGLLVPPNDSVSLANAINRLLEDENLRKKLSDNAYQFVVNNMTWEKVIPKYLKFYNELLK